MMDLSKLKFVGYRFKCPICGNLAHLKALKRDYHFVVKVQFRQENKNDPFKGYFIHIETRDPDIKAQIWQEILKKIQRVQGKREMEITYTPHTVAEYISKSVRECIPETYKEVEVKYDKEEMYQIR